MSSDPARDRDPVKISGNPTPEEVAAVLSVVSTIAAGSAVDPTTGTAGSTAASAWADPRRSVRTPLPHGAAAWRLSTAPR